MSTLLMAAAEEHETWGGVTRPPHRPVRGLRAAADRPLLDLGSHALRDIPEPQRVFTLP